MVSNTTTLDSFYDSKAAAFGFVALLDCADRLHAVVLQNKVMDNREPAQAWLQATLQALQPVMQVPQQVLLQVRTACRAAGFACLSCTVPRGPCDSCRTAQGLRLQQQCLMPVWI